MSFRDVEELLLWRAVDQDGDVLDILVQGYRNAHAAKRFFRKLLKGQKHTPLELVTDRLKSYGAARRSIMLSGDLIVLAAFGAGFTWAWCVLCW